MADPFQRKRDHLALCHQAPVQVASHEGLWSEVHLVHNALPELSGSELQLDTPFLRHRLRAPLMVTGMTGGPPEAGTINRQLAQLCQRHGLAFGIGSQRIMDRVPASLETFRVREIAPDVVLLGNLGVNQVRDLGIARARELFRMIEADYLAVHLNPAQELAQVDADADADFRDGYATVARLVEALEGRVLVKECGAGLSPAVVQRLYAAGVRAVDVSGSGGTSWVQVEALRAAARPGAERKARLGRLFADWGIPAAAAVMGAVGRGPLVIASGGIDQGLSLARALALGAQIGGMARPVLRALLDHGVEGAEAYLGDVLYGLRMTMLLTGCRKPEELRRVPRVLGPTLAAWERTWATSGPVG
ncbi:MAG: type 2 isopentenyl-diphosphate Delta-isomerase [Xanthomonadales bacterium]|nr:type 2 isopentenyl-diphosphate Delta-isomerase [Xanthomonadales bacterium]